MVSSFNQKHNKYTSTPDWFKDSKSIGDSVAGSGTNYGGAVIGSTYNTVDYSEIPIDNSTIVWQDEKLAVPIDNSTIIINDEKLSVPIDNDTIIIKDGKLVVSFDENDLQDDYVTIKGDQDIEGVKNFKPGVLIDGVRVTKPQDDVIYIDGNLAVKGGITIYADDGNVDVSSIYDGLPIDKETLIWVEDVDGNKVLKANSGTIKKIETDGKGNAITSVTLGDDNSTLLFHKNGEFAYQSQVDIISDNLDELDTEFHEFKDYAETYYVTVHTEQEIYGKKNFTTGGLFVNGNQIIYNKDDDYWMLKGDLLITGGITTYVNDGTAAPSLFEALPIDQQTILRNEAGALMINPNLEFGLNEEELISFLEANKYATQSWVYGLKYASASALTNLSDKVNDFLEGSDTDTIINKWKELETFLSGLSETDNLATILGTKANQSDLDDTNDVVATKWTQDDTKINNWDNAYKWGNHADVGYALKSYVDNEFKKYVTLADDQTISGVKTFTNGLKIGTSTINQSQNDVVYIDANLVVRGGITMYSDNTVDVGTIFDALPIDGNTIYWENGVLKANITEGVITNITSDMVVGALGFTPYNASNPKGYISGITSAMVVSALGYTPLQNHQTIYALTIQKNGTNIGTYTPNSAKKTINIVVPTKVSELDNDEEYATTSDLDSRIDALINGAPTAFDTLKEIADVLQGNVNSIGDIITTLGTKADKAIKISAGTGLSGGGTLEADRTLSLATSGVTAGTYKSVTVDKYGRVTSGTNPTTLAGYGITDAYTKTKVDELLGNYVTIATKQSITGEKNFTGGLKVNGSPIVYDATNKYWKLEGDLLVTGGVTMFASDSAFTPSTIMDAIATDNVNLKVVDGVLTFVGQTGGGVADSVHWDNVDGKPTFATVATSGKYSDLSGVPTLLSSFIDDVVDRHYLPLSGGDVNGDLNIYGNPQSINKNGMMIFHNLSLNQGGVFKYKGGDKWTVSNSGGTTEYTILHSNNWSQFVTGGDGGNYLPLSGGTISGGFGVLTVERNEPWACSIKYKNTSSILGYIGFDDDFKAKTWDRNKSNAKVIAFESSNVASATKLQTARTIWGQSFDGTGDVNGMIYVKVSSGHITADFKSASSSQSILAYTKSNGITWSTGVGVRDGGDSFGFWSTTSQLCVLSIDISGNVLSQGGITMYSDIRKKTKLQDVELSLKQIADAPLIEHYYNSDAMRTTHVGSIAQYWAGLNDWFCKLDSEGYYTMEIQNAALASAISIARELVKYESKTDRKIRLLKQRVKELEEKIEKLENN